MRETSNAKRIAPLGAVAAFGVALYAYIPPLPCFRDDMVMLLWLKDMSWARLWADATGFPYYRPLSFSTLKLSELVFGWPEPISLHVLHLFLHAANSVMVALLTSRFFRGKGSTFAGLSAGLLFAAYPFTYEIVPTTGPIFQLQAAFFGLGAALCYSRFRISDFGFRYTLPARELSNLQSEIRNQKWLWASLALALLGTFTCEYGAILPLFIVAVEVMHAWSSRTDLTAKGAPTSRSGKDAKIFDCLPLRSLRFKDFSLLPLLYFGFAAAYLAIWAIVPKSRSEPPLLLQGLAPALRDMPLTALYYLQGLTYPLQTLVWPLVRATGLSRELAVLLIGMITLAGVVLVFARARRLPLLVFALAWFAVCVAPMWPSLNADYTLNGPRLHYLPSIATTLMWGSFVAILLSHRQDTKDAKHSNGCEQNQLGLAACHSERSEESPPRLTETLRLPQLRRGAQGDKLVQGLGLLVLAGTLAQSVAFLADMGNLITIGGRLTADTARAVATSSADALSPTGSTLVVNFPSWIGKRETTYALGAEGLSFLPGYSYMRDLVLLNTRQERDVSELTFPNTIKEWKYDQRLGALVDWEQLAKTIRKSRQVWAVEYLPDTLRVSEAGAVVQAATSDPPEAVFDGKVGMRLADVRAMPGELRVELTWTIVLTVERQFTAFVHLYGPDGKIVAQQDGYPLLGLYPPWLQSRGELVRDVRRIDLRRIDLRRIDLPAPLAAGSYTLGIGVYNLETGQRVEARSPAGARFENDVYLMTISNSKYQISK